MIMWRPTWGVHGACAQVVKRKGLRATPFPGMGDPAGEAREGGGMNIDTTFKEFVDERGINFLQLDFGSRKYRSLVEAFNNAKSELGAEAEAREHEKIRAWLVLNEQSAMEKLRNLRARRRGRRVSAVPGLRLVVS